MAGHGADEPVCLTRSAPDTAYAGKILFYDVITEDVISRSGLLSSVAEASGDIRLPAFVTLSEFKSWINTLSTFAPLPSDTIGQSKRREPDDMDLKEVCSVLKVADALDDRHYNDWLKLAEAKLFNHALACVQNKPCDLQQVADGVAKLPDYLQQRVFETATRDRTAESMGMLLRLLPSCHHAAIVSAAITPDKALTAPERVFHLQFIDSLSLLPASPPSLLSLSLPRIDLYIQTNGDLSENPPLHAAAADLADALRHHSSLTSLRLASFIDSASLQSLAPAISTLTSLQELHLGGPRNGVPVDATPLVQVALRALSSLQHLRLRFSLADVRQQASSPSSADDAPSDQPQHCLSDLLSPVTALTSLELRITDAAISPGRQILIAAHPLRLPALQRLSITTRCDDTAATLLSQLIAPLSSLQLVSREAAPSTQEPAVSSPVPQQLWAGLAKFVQLVRLDVVLVPPTCAPKVYDGETEAARRSSSLARAPEQDIHSVPSLAALTGLQELSLSARLPVLLHAVQQLAAGSGSLRRLHLQVSFSQDAPVRSTCTAREEAWDALISHLSRMRLLQHLQIGQDLGLSGNAYPRRVASSGIAALQLLTALTALHIDEWWSCVGRPEDVEALSCMQQLRSVCLREFSAPAVVQVDCVGTLAALPSLSQLALQPTRDDNALLAAFLEHATAVAWPSLQWLGLFVECALDLDPAVRAMAAFPALKEIDFLASVMRPNTFERLRAVAADSGVRMCTDRDWRRFEWKSVWGDFN